MDLESQDAKDRLKGVSEMPDGFFLAKLSYLGRIIELGAYRDVMEAAKARDRALIRAKGPDQCTKEELNLPISTYAYDPSHVFTQYDEHLHLGLVHSEWTGPKDYDFSDLLIPAGQTAKKRGLSRACYLKDDC